MTPLLYNFSQLSIRGNPLRLYNLVDTLVQQEAYWKIQVTNEIGLGICKGMGQQNPSKLQEVARSMSRGWEDTFLGKCRWQAAGKQQENGKRAWNSRVSMNMWQLYVLFEKTDCTAAIRCDNCVTPINSYLLENRTGFYYRHSYFDKSDSLLWKQHEYLK